MSTPIQDGGPAFPGFSHTEGRGPVRRTPSDEWEYHTPSMTIRDWFAGQVMAGLAANPKNEGTWEDDMKAAFYAADIAIKTREAQP